MTQTAGIERSSLARAALLGFALPIGWGLHDLAVFAVSGQPSACFDLLPGIVRASLVGSLVSVLVLRRRRLALASVLIAIAAAVATGTGVVDVLTTPAQRDFPGALAFALAFAMYALRSRDNAQTTARSTALRGIAWGLFAAVTHTLWRNGVASVSWPAVPVALALAATSSNVHRRTRVWEAPAVVTVFTLAIALVAVRARENAAVARPDLAPPPSASGHDAPNLLLIVLDTARADRMGLYGYERATTPSIDAFAAAHATRYDQARSTASWTLPSHASLFTGEMPGVHGVTNPRGTTGGKNASGEWSRPVPLAETTPTLAERLRERGYQTAAIASNQMIGAWSGLDRGFEHYDDRAGAAVGRYHAFAQLGGRAELVGHTPYRDAREVTNTALEWLDDERRGTSAFFLFLNYMDVHNPYRPPPPFDAAFAPEQPRNKFRPEPELWSLLYDREFAYLDAELGRLLDGVQGRGLFGDTLIVITSDHGEAFGEHDTWIHGWSLHEELIHVPLIVKPPGTRSSTASDELVTGADVHDLILRELGIDADRAQRAPSGHVAEWYYSESIKMLPGLPGKKQSELAHDELAWIEGNVKTLVTSNGDVRAFDLTRDALEQTPLALDQAAIDAARERANAWWAAHPPPEREAQPLDTETLDGLRELGYIGSD